MGRVCYVGRVQMFHILVNQINSTLSMLVKTSTSINCFNSFN